MQMDNEFMADEAKKKPVVIFTKLTDPDPNDIDWLSKTPTERIEALEFMRRWIYGDDKFKGGVQRVFEFGKLGQD